MVWCRRCGEPDLATKARGLDEPRAELTVGVGHDRPVRRLDGDSHRVVTVIRVTLIHRGDFVAVARAPVPVARAAEEDGVHLRAVAAAGPHGRIVAEGHEVGRPGREPIAATAAVRHAKREGRAFAI